MNIGRALMVAAAIWPGLQMAAPASRAQEVEMHSLMGKPAPAFEVADSQGRKRSLAEFRGRIVVLEWTSSSCPFVKAQYESGVIQQVQKSAAAQGVVWLSVLSTHPSRRDYLPGPRAEAMDKERGAAPAALLMDAGGRMGKAYGAVVTPQMFVIDASGTVVYSGAASDKSTMNAEEVRKSRNYVQAALDDMKAGRRIATPTSRPFGCTVAYSGY